MTSTFTCEKCGGGSYEQFSQTQVRCLQCGTVNLYDTGYKVVPEFQLSKDEDLLNLEKKVAYKIAPLSKRLINYIVDVFFIIFVMLILANIFDITDSITANKNNLTINVMAFIIIPIYYLFMEYKFGKTLGKFVTRTSVISTNSNELSFAQCSGRVLCRMIPLYQLSGLFMNGTFWHDSIPNTLVVEDK